MEEIKETKTKKIIKFLIDHIMIISAIIFLCVLLFSSCSTAHAESMNSSAENYIRSVLQSASNYSSEESALSYVFSTYNNYIELVTNDSSPVTYFILYVDDVYLFTPRVNSSNNNNAPFQFFVSTSSGYNATSAYALSQHNYDYYPLSYSGSSRTCSCTITYISSVNQFMITQYTFGSCSPGSNVSYSCYSVDIDSFNTGTITSYNSKSVYFATFSNRSINVISGFNGGHGASSSYCTVKSGTQSYVFDGSVLYDLTPITLYNGPEYSEDSRLRMYITNAIGGPRLNVNVVDFAKSFPYPDQTVLQPKEITLTIETDGVESLFTLDQSTAIWASKYWATVPVSDVAELDGHDVVKITKVQFSMYDALANMTEDFYIATDFALKDTTEEIDSSNILPPGDIYEDAKSTAQIDLLVQTLEANGSGSVYGDFTYQSSIPVLPAWSDEIYTDLTRMEDTSSAFAGHWYDHYPWSFGDLQINPVEYINEFCDGYASVYDVIIFRVYGWMLDASFSTDDPTIGSYSTGVKGYIVLYTNKFYNHSTSLTSLDILTVLQNDANQQKSNWSWLVSKLKDFESKSLEVMNAELRVERESRDWLKSIWNQIDNLDMPLYDDSDLLDKLDLIISEIDEIAGFFTGESGEGYNRFTEWLEKIENDGEITPHEWANEIFNYVTGLYHSISDGTAFYTNDITDYINYVNQNGTSDPGNYFFAMLEGTYNPHRYNGWTGGS